MKPDAQARGMALTTGGSFKFRTDRINPLPLARKTEVRFDFILTTGIGLFEDRSPGPAHAMADMGKNRQDDLGTKDQEDEVI